MKNAIIIPLLALIASTASAQFSEDIIFHNGTNGIEAAQSAPEVFAVDWSAHAFAPLRREWERLGRAKPRQFPSMWSSDAHALVPWAGTYTGTVDAATSPEARPARRRLRQLIGQRPTEKAVQNALEDRRGSIAAAGTLAAVKTNIVQLIDVLLADRSAAVERDQR